MCISSERWPNPRTQANHSYTSPCDDGPLLLCLPGDRSSHPLFACAFPSMQPWDRPGTSCRTPCPRASPREGRRCGVGPCCGGRGRDAGIAGSTPPSTTLRPPQFRRCPSPLPLQDHDGGLLAWSHCTGAPEPRTCPRAPRRRTHPAPHDAESGRLVAPQEAGTALRGIYKVWVRMLGGPNPSSACKKNAVSHLPNSWPGAAAAPGHACGTPRAPAPAPVRHFAFPSWFPCRGNKRDTASVLSSRTGLGTWGTETAVASSWRHLQTVPALLRARRVCRADRRTRVARILSSRSSEGICGARVKGLRAGAAPVEPEGLTPRPVSPATAWPGLAEASRSHAARTTLFPFTL